LIRADRARRDAAGPTPEDRSVDAALATADRRRPVDEARLESVNAKRQVRGTG
jgi:hypothetical protein